MKSPVFTGLFYTMSLIDVIVFVFVLLLFVHPALSTGLATTLATILSLKVSGKVYVVGMADVSSWCLVCCRLKWRAASRRTASLTARRRQETLPPAAKATPRQILQVPQVLPPVLVHSHRRARRNNKYPCSQDFALQYLPGILCKYYKYLPHWDMHISTWRYWLMPI